MLPVESFLDILTTNSKLGHQMNPQATETASAAKGLIMRNLQVPISHRQSRNTYMPSVIRRHILICSRRSQSTPIITQQLRLLFQGIQTNTLRPILGTGTTRMRTYMTVSQLPILIIFLLRMG